MLLILRHLTGRASLSLRRGAATAGAILPLNSMLPKLSKSQELITIPDVQQASHGGETRAAVAALHSTAELDRIPTQKKVIGERKKHQSRSASSHPDLPCTAPLAPRHPSSPSYQGHIEERGRNLDAVEIYVDSSGWGIGLSLNGRWLAWKLRPGWNVDGRDNNWAEMIAVELGLLVFISSGLYLRNPNVIIWSDNLGVVKSLVTGKSRHPAHPEVILRIQEMIRPYGLSLEVRWVSTKENAADKISRGVFPSLALQLEFSPCGFPTTHLKPFLSDAPARPSRHDH